MPPSNALRSFAITLAIAIAVIAPEASGFTLNRNNYVPTTEQHTDPVADESSLLQVKDDLKILDNIQQTTHGESDKPPAGHDTNDTETGLEIIKESNDVTPTKQPSLAQTTASMKSSTTNPTIPTISSDTVEVYDSTEDEKFREAGETKENSTETSAPSSEFDFNETVLSLESTVPEKSSETEPSTVPDQTSTNTEVIGASSRESANTDTPKNNSEMPEATTKITETSYMNTPENEALSQTVSETSLLSTIQNDESSPPTDAPLPSTLSDADETQIATDANFTEPWWGKYTKYTTIVRERVSSAESTTQTMKAVDDAMKAETSNTQLNIETAFDATPISPFQKKRIDLQTSTSHSTPSDETSFQETENSTATMQPTAPTLYNVITIGPKRKETVQAKRAGYLDNSEKPTTPLDTFFVKMAKDDELVTFGTVDENDAEPESLDFKNKNHTNLESQRQLAEDALQEELLKEETLNDHNDNANRYRDERIKDEKPGAAADAEELLQVRPISGERAPPGLRPMKKLDVQPARPLHRDPDDNSWRNESISSLGIVFKPKVATKSFKEVLKKKTQTELNNLQEKDAKDEVPDLRVRLEKIAEVRKTKKKKMNKDGEQVYSDYEEGHSGEAGGSPQPDGPALLSSAEMSKLLTPSHYPAALEPTTPTSVDLEAHKAKTRILPVPEPDRSTPKRPKKKFNLAEYYDSTDEYDADYVTMPNIDLKKFPRPPTTTPPPPIPPPERRPTVQYFPPRPPLKVNVDNFDPNFERKVNLFTFRDAPVTEPRPQFTPATEPRPQFATVPALLVVSRASPAAQLSASYYGPPRGTAPPSRALGGELGRGSYVIKHYKDFLHAAAQETDDDRRAAGSAPRRVPPAGDADSRPRSEVLDRFVADFNRQSERFKVDFPVLLDRAAGEGAASPAPAPRVCARCDVTVELSPAYELHYYVPGQEEREEPPGAPAA